MNKEAMLWEKLDDRRVRCCLCAHECRIDESKFGICGVRRNIDGVLNTMVYAQPVAMNIDPVEKKPLYHFLPGTSTYSIATVGCNFRCGFCQNWQISQVSMTDDRIFPRQGMSPGQIVEEAKARRCQSISYTYTEPTVFFEYAYDTAVLARQAGLCNIFVTNGYMTAAALDTIRPVLDGANVDLKSFRDTTYRKHCKARLQPVLDTIARMSAQGIWLEVTTLVIPGENDSDAELRDIAAFLAGIDKNIPWHLSRFHPDYAFQDRVATPTETLRRAKEIGRESGLRFIYLGNVSEGTDTYCYHCNERLVERRYMGLEKLHLTAAGRCPSCDTQIDGIWQG